MKHLCIGILMIAVCALSAAGQKLKAEEIVARHLESIGTADARAKVKNRIAVGRVMVRFITQKNQAEGRIVLASDAGRNFTGMSLTAGDYESERFVFDGRKTYVGSAHNGVRSVLGNFVQSNNWIVEESIFGGTLAGTWALSDAGKGKMSADGLKKVDGKEYYVLGYSRKGGGDLDVKLYFDKETFRHVRTEYKRMSSAGIGRTPEESSGFIETRHRVVEEFSDHKEVGGLMLPHHYRLLYSVSGQKGTTEVEWTFELTQFDTNLTLDENTFSAQ